MERSIDAAVTVSVPFRQAEVFLRRPPLGAYGEAVDRTDEACAYRSHLDAEARKSLPRHPKSTIPWRSSTAPPKTPMRRYRE